VEGLDVEVDLYKSKGRGARGVVHGRAAYSVVLVVASVVYKWRYA
jgi:hypothetical protein